jgi:hypothetical protein
VSSHNNLRFRMTLRLWPGAPLALPPLLPGKATYQLHDSGLALIGTGDPLETKAGRRLGEIYLELYALDLEDKAAIVDFADKYGTPSGGLVHLALAGHSWFKDLFPTHDDQLAGAVLRSDRELMVRMDPTNPEGELVEITSLESFRFAARILADLTDAWRIVKADPHLEVTSHRWRLDYPEDEQTKASPFFAFHLLTDGLTRLLARVHPYVQPPSRRLDAEPEEAEEHQSPSGLHIQAARSMAFAHLAEFCALELFNHIAGSEAYRQCENESCRRVFVRQYGRAEHGQSRREGVRYCSRACAQAQAARAYRRRKRIRAPS